MKPVFLSKFLILFYSAFPQALLALGSLDPIRVCKPHEPLPTNSVEDPLACERELASLTNTKDPDADKSIAQISVENGYLFETHNVTTMDGYLLTSFRIPGGLKSPAKYGKPAVLLLHGLGGSSESWIAQPNNKSLAYLLADAGWDVWLSNNRGTTFSNGHNTLNSERDILYWDFSFHEMGKYDLPVTVDQVLNVSSHDKIFVIGHSQGSSSFLVGASEIPELNTKINAAYLMAPAAIMGGAYEPFLTSVLPIINTPIQDLVYNTFGGRIQRKNARILPTTLGLQLHDFCQPRAFRCGLCGTIFGTNTFNPTQMNYTNVPRIVSKLFNVENLKSTIHFGQNIRSCSFLYYDHGLNENLKRYGTPVPPRYRLENITAPLHLLWAEQDYLVTPPDVQRLAKELSPPALQSVIRVDDDTFDHTDFAVARDADVLVYKPLISMLNTAWHKISAGSVAT